MTCRQIENLFDMERMADKYWGSQRHYIVTTWLALFEAITDGMICPNPESIIELPKGVKPKDIITSATEEYVF